MSPLSFNSRKGCRYLSFLLVYLFVFSCMHHMVLADDDKKDKKDEQTDAFTQLDVSEAYGSGVVDKVSGPVAYSLVLVAILTSVSPLLLSSAFPTSMTSMTSPSVIVLLVLVFVLSSVCSYSISYALLSAKTYVAPTLFFGVPLVTVSLVFFGQNTGLVTPGTEALVRSILMIVAVVQVATDVGSLSLVYMKSKAVIGANKLRVWKALKCVEKPFKFNYDIQCLSLSDTEKAVKELTEHTDSLEVFISKASANLSSSQCKVVLGWCSSDIFNNFVSAVKVHAEKVKDPKPLYELCKSNDNASEDQKKLDNIHKDFVDQMLRADRLYAKVVPSMRSIGFSDGEESSKK